jgi:GDPmannose 4,6-dehydratase
MTSGVALITGAAGQDGRYVATQLKAAGMRIVGTTHQELAHRIVPEYLDEFMSLDLRSAEAVRALIDRVRPSMIFNLGARSSGAGMYDDTRLIAEVNGLAVGHLLEAIRNIDPSIRLLQASSSEMFGHTSESPQSESTPFTPRSPYGAAKVFAHSMVRIYRERYSLFTCSAILFNHESPFRGAEFVSRKITQGAAKIRLGIASYLTLGNLEAKRDWGFAGDYARAMRLMLEQPTPRDYVVATGKTHTVSQICEIAFSRVNLDFRDHVKLSSDDFRPPEALQLVGNPQRIEAELGWKREVGFEQMIRDMTDADLTRLSAK